MFPASSQPSVVAVVPTYCPEQMVIDLCDGLEESGIPTLVADDASPCTSDPILNALDPHTTVIRFSRNAGIARSLNAGLEHAFELGAEWLLTVDQDSSINGDYVANLVDFAGNSCDAGAKIGAVGAEVISDASGQIRYPTRHNHFGSITINSTEEIMQTGSLWNVAAMRAMGGFDERLGIDAVDAAACLRLREAGYLVALAPGLTLSHTLGASRQINLFGRQVIVSGHSPERRTTIVRNRLKLFPAEFAQSPAHALRTLRRVGVNAILGSVLEENRWEKTKATFRGFLPNAKH